MFEGGVQLVSSACQYDPMFWFDSLMLTYEQVLLPTQSDTVTGSSSKSTAELQLHRGLRCLSPADDRHARRRERSVQRSLIIEDGAVI